MMAQMMIISSMMLNNKPPEDVKEDLELLGVIVNNTIKTTDKIGIIKIPLSELKLKSNDEVVQNTIRIVDKDVAYIPYYRTNSVRLQDITQPASFTSINGGRLYPDYQLYTHLFFDLAKSTGQYEVWARRVNDGIHVVLIIKEAGVVKEAIVSLDVGSIINMLNIPRGLALEVAEALAKYAEYKVIDCIQYDATSGECLREIEVRELANSIEVYLTRIRRGRELALIREKKLILPRIKRINDPFYGEYFIATDDDGRIIIAVNNVRDLISELQNRGYIVERIDKYILSIISRIQTIKGYITPGISIDGKSIIDPYGELDLNDYGVDGLIKARDWVKANYGPNVDQALANIAFAIAKIITPYVRYWRRNFVDYIIWNYGEGGEAKTSLTFNILVPLLGGIDLIALHGAIRTDAQIRNLASLNRLPLILDEQRLDNLVRIAGFIIENAVGMGITGVHAKQYGLGIGAKFYNLRGIIIFTNAPFTSFLANVRGLASDYAFTRRVMVIDWIPYKPYLTPPPEVKPILGAVNKVLKMFEFKDADNLITLARQLITALAVTYNVDLSDYLKAIDNIAKEASEQSLIESDDDKLRYSAYQFTRELGIVIKSWHDVVDAVLNNSNASKVELVQGEQDEIQEVSRRVITLLGADPNEPGSYQHHNNFPASIVRALDNGLVKVRLWAGGLNGGIPSVKQFLGAPRIHKHGRGAYYIVSLDRFLQAIINQANTQ